MKRIIRQNFDLSSTEYDDYEQATGRFESLATRLLDELTRRHTGPLDVMLDLGAGTGASTRVYDDRTEVVALDLSRAMLSRNQTPLRVQGDMESLPFAADSFDAAMFSASLFLAPDLATAIREARRVLRHGGTVGAVVPLGWFTGDGADVFDDLERESRSPRSASTVRDELAAGFELDSGEVSFETSPANLRRFHAMPAAAARVYPNLPPAERVERVTALLADVEGPLEHRWRWYIGHPRRRRGGN